MEKITKTKKYEMLSEALALIEQEGIETKLDLAMLQEFVASESQALTRKSEKAKAKAAEKKTELDELAQVVLSVLGTDPMTCDEVTNQIEGDDVTTAKVRARLSKLVTLGYAEKSEIAATSASGKKTTHMAYALVPAETDETSDSE